MGSLHARIALLTLLPVLLWASVRFVERQRLDDAAEPPVQIGIEHAGNAALTLTRTIGRAPQLIDVANDGAAAVRVSLPDAWRRGEVRGVPLAAIAADAPEFGFRRWHLPPGATLSFTSPLPPAGMIVHNPSGFPLRLKTVTVDLENNEVTREVHLLSEEPLEIP